MHSQTSPCSGEAGQGMSWGPFTSPFAHQYEACTFSVPFVLGILSFSSEHGLVKSTDSGSYELKQICDFQNSFRDPSKITSS
ncbi:hypothetical protein D5086_016595 [Populus alba]|uniref:Uncharacterized protein n=1 Tax=Populus alba TaxID=43335 RepID=A0ACC4BUE5_POPAL